MILNKNQPILSPSIYPKHIFDVIDRNKNDLVSVFVANDSDSNSKR